MTPAADPVPDDIDALRSALAAGDDTPPPAGPSDGASGETIPRNAERNWRGQTRSNATHRSLTDPDARLARKSEGQSSILPYAGHVLMENRNGLLSGACLACPTFGSTY
jgi:hypothetical protein